MAGDSGYATNLRDIPVSFFKAMLVSDIKKLIHTYGHKNCGLRQEELCNKIKEIISQKKNIIFEHMDTASKKKWSDEWNSERSKYFDKLYKEEGFINMCFPKKYTNNPSLNKLMSKHIDFCKEKDERRSALGNNPEYNVCKQYNIWINEKTVSFTLEFLKNVTAHKYPTVKKYFSTKEYPGGHDPRDTYRNSKLNCEIYNPATSSHPQIPLAKASTDSTHLPTSPDVGQESQRKGGKSIPDEKGKTEITKPDVIQLPKGEPSPSDSLTPSLTTTKMYGSDSGKEPRTSPENAPTETTTTDHSKSSHNDGEQIRNNVLLFGTAVPESPPVPELIPVSKDSPDYNDPDVKTFLYSLRTNLDGQIITHDIHDEFKRKPVNISNNFRNNIQGKPIKPSISESYKLIPRKLLHKEMFLPHLLSKQQFNPPTPRSQQIPTSILYSQRFTKTFPNVVNYLPKHKFMKAQEPFSKYLSPFPVITSASGNKEMEVVKIELPTPDPSLFRSPVMIYTLFFLVLFTITTMLFLLSKYTTFGLVFGKNKKKKRLKSQLQITKLEKEVSHFNTMDNYSTNHTPYENKKGNEKNIYNQIKMQKGIIHKNIILPKRKKKNHKAIIDIHMELLNECKNDEWELNKDDFLQICLEQFTKEQNKIYSNSKNSNLITKSLSTENAKEAKMLLWDKWTEKYTPIWENFKRGNTFKILQYYWKEEENSHLYKIKNENSSLNQNENFSYIQIKKDIWKRWTTKQAKLIEQYKEEQWFKSLVEELENVSDEYKNGKIKDDIFVSNIKELENKDNNEDLYKHVKHIFLIKVFIQILMMVIEECIKEESSEKTEIVLDNLIEKLNKEKHENIELENIHQENMNHKEYNEMLEQKKPKNQENFKELIEGQKAKMIYK